jgi:peroxiredoxin/uncharacterized membrane protein YphA (DoxX/SURF4 family)
MDTFLLLVRIVLFGIFAVAGVAKLLDLKGSVTAAEDFGVPDSLARPIGYVLPFAEIAIAIALIPVAATRWSAVAGALLMAAFVTAMAINLARGKRPDCHCFGKLHSAPIGWQTIARNGAIGIAALVVAISGPGSSLATWLDNLDGQGQLLLGFLLVALVVLAWQSWSLEQLTRSTTKLASRVDTFDGLINGEREHELPGPKAGTEAPGFSLPAIGKSLTSLADLQGLGKPTLLVFAEPTCSVCNTLMPKLGRWSRDLEQVLTLAVVTTGSEEENRKKVDRYALPWVLLQEKREVTMAYRVPGAPAAILVDREGRVANQMVYGADAITSLLNDIAEFTSTNAAPQPAERGRHAPVPGSAQIAGAGD